MGTRPALGGLRQPRPFSRPAEDRRDESELLTWSGIKYRRSAVVTVLVLLWLTFWYVQFFRKLDFRRDEILAKGLETQGRVVDKGLPASHTRIASYQIKFAYLDDQQVPHTSIITCECESIRVGQALIVRFLKEQPDLSASPELPPEPFQLLVTAFVILSGCAIAGFAIWQDARKRA